MTLQYTVLHLEIARCVIYPRQQKYWQNVRWSIQDGRPNSGTSICKLTFWHFSCEITHLHTQNLSFQKPISYRTLKCLNEHSICIWLVAFGRSVKRNPMESIVIFFKMRYVYSAKPLQYNFINLALPISGLAALIRECKLNWYSTYSYSENRQPRTLTSIVQIITRKKRTYGIVQCTCMT